MALAHEDRQVGGEPGEMTVATERCGAQCPPYMGKHAIDRHFYLGTQAPDRKLR